MAKIRLVTVAALQFAPLRTMYPPMSLQPRDWLELLIRRVQIVSIQELLRAITLSSTKGGFLSSSKTISGASNHCEVRILIASGGLLQKLFLSGLSGKVFTSILVTLVLSVELNMQKSESQFAGISGFLGGLLSSYGTSRCRNILPYCGGSEPQDDGLDSGITGEVMQGHAGANVVPLVASNRIGKEIIETEHGNSEITFYGYSFIAAQFDLDKIKSKRHSWGVYRDRRPDLYKDSCIFRSLNRAPEPFAARSSFFHSNKFGIISCGMNDHYTATWKHRGH
ncbi:hypothetical protein HAX54_004577 [Datura stramonium]|uniref:Uncharacterized protein n=1 Tax=Datura stramonium TaxID=4076 RepID=A0ABS8T7X7_DATST|nr:hypothetical protein [Datura stramonium]